MKKSKTNIREPDFSSEEDMFVLVTDRQEKFDNTDDLTLRANILIFSYNRPRMLKEAIDSVLAQEYNNMDIYIVDDGSDCFNPWSLIDSYKDKRILLAAAPPISLKERMAMSRLGANANAVIKRIPKKEPVYYLCDDDVMAPKWIPRSIRAFQDLPDIHVVQGEAWYFEDGQDPFTESVYGMPMAQDPSVPTMYWSTGSFGHRALCCKDEGLWWSDNEHLHSHDTNFIMDFWHAHENYGVVPTPALYRREHKNTLSAKLGRKDEYGKYARGFVPGKATEEMLAGEQE